MAYMDELRVGEDCTVADLQTGKVYQGVIEALAPDATNGSNSRVIVRCTSGRTVRVSPGFVSLVGAEA